MPWEQLVQVPTLACLLQGGRLELCASRPNAQGRFSDNPQQLAVLWNVYRASALDNFKVRLSSSPSLPLLAQHTDSTVRQVICHNAGARCFKQGCSCICMAWRLSSAK